jgi:hypothetical protein
MARHSDLFKKMKTKLIHAKRLAAHMIEDVEAHFTEFARCKRKWGILDDDISNFDETGFLIGVTNGEYVIVPTDCDVVY